MIQNPEISILLPSLRPELCNETINLFKKTNGNIDYEIIVVSPFEVKSNKVKWVREKKKEGSVVATNEAHRYSKGDYVVYFSDDVSPTKDCLENMLEFMRIGEGVERKNLFIGAFRMETPNGKEIGPFAAYGKLYACYGCVSRNTVAILGPNVFDYKFLYSWGDIDLSLKCWLAGGEVKVCNSAVMIPRQVEDDVYKEHRHIFYQDFESFANHWHPILGQNIPKIHGEINKKLIKGEI